MEVVNKVVKSRDFVRNFMKFVNEVGVYEVKMKDGSSRFVEVLSTNPNLSVKKAEKGTQIVDKGKIVDKMSDKKEPWDNDSGPIMANTPEDAIRGVATILLNKKARVEKYGYDPYIDQETVKRSGFVPNYIANINHTSLAK